MEFNMSRAGWGVLFFLVSRGGSLTPTELHTMILRSKHTVTEIVDTLEANGLVTRNSAIDDRRKKHIEITKKGLRLVRLINPKRSVLSNKVFASLKKSEIEQLAKMLKQIDMNLVQHIESAIKSKAGRRVIRKKKLILPTLPIYSKLH